METTGRRRSRVDLCVDTTKLHSLAVRELVQGGEPNVEARCGVVDCDNIDVMAVVAQVPAGAALVRVPAWNLKGATDEGVRERAEGGVA